MRRTYCVPAELTYPLESQMKLDTMWLLIENSYTEDWRIEANGDVELTVDNDLLHRIAEDNREVFEQTFGSRDEHNEETRNYEWLDLPEELQGLYIIRGIYDANQRFISRDQNLTYFFVQEGF